MILIYLNDLITPMSLMKYKDWFGSFEYEADDEMFHGRVLGIRDVVHFCGASVDELKQALADSVEDYLEACASAARNRRNRIPDDFWCARRKMSTAWRTRPPHLRARALTPLPWKLLNGLLGTPLIKPVHNDSQAPWSPRCRHLLALTAYVKFAIIQS